MKVARIAFIALAFLGASNLTPVGALDINKLNQAQSNAELGIRLYNGRRYAEAARQLADNIKSEHGSGIASNYYYLGNCYYSLNRKKQAVQMYKMVLGRFPDSSESKSARTMLARLSPESLTEIRSSAPASASSSSTASPSLSNVNIQDLKKLIMARSGVSDTNQDLSRLPRENRFFFTLGRGGHMEVDIYLNGKKMKALFDTGASAHFGINHLRAAGIYDVPRGKPNGYTSGWAQNKVPVWRTMMKLRIGNMERAVPVTIEKNMKLEPLVGQQFISGYEYEIQSTGQHKYVTMVKKTSEGSIYQNHTTSSIYDVPCITKSMREFVEMEINGRKVQVLLDTGANSTILDEGIASKLGINIPADAPTTVGIGVGGKMVYKIVPVNIKLGPINQKDFPVQIGRTGGLCAVGQDILSKHRFKIDRQKKLLRFFH